MKVIELPFRVKRPMLACGADLKGAFALAKGNKAYIYDDFGDLSDLDNFTRYERAIKAVGKKLDIAAQIVVCDLHPDYFSTRFARENRDRSHFSGKIFQAQHHEAHIASAIIDSDVEGDVLGAAFDGTGYGSDGNIWGGEFFYGGLKNLKRVAHLEYIPMPGAEACIEEPWRMAASYIYLSGANAGKYYPAKWPLLKKMVDNKINSPLTSSMGRLFDAVGSLVLNKMRAGFEAELPIKLEKIADKDEKGHYGFDMKGRDGKTIINMARTIRGILKDLDKHILKPNISAKFHNTIALVILEIVKKFDADKVALSGGVFQNKFLCRKTRELLEAHGFKVYTHSHVETNDCGIPLGQIAIANYLFPKPYSLNPAAIIPRCICA